jgi:dipeptidyl-peptidase-4
MNITFADLPGDSEDYICRVNWLLDNQSLAIQTQSRNQQRLDLLVWNSTTTQINQLLTEQSTTWLNLHDIFYPLANGEEFIWASERSGYQHLYHYNLNGTLLNTLTSGQWVVTDLCRVCEESATGIRVYFEGFMDTPLEKHLYCVDFNADPRPQRITKPGYFHSTTFSTSYPYFIDHFSSAATPPAVALRNLDGDTISDLAVNELNEAHPYHPYLASRGIVSFGELEAEDGQTLHYRLIKPAHLKENEKCPAIVTVYGGPGVQRVTNEWIPAWHHYMTQQGYALLQLDNRGTANRGKKFEDPIYLNMGEVEVADQLKGVDYLKQLPFIDANRIGVFGHSYGGYMTLMMMMKSDQFNAGVSVAPVTDWGLYDTHYTERFLGHPRDNAQGYKQSNVFPFAKGLTGKLLMIHGMADDNVLLSHSTKLYKLLQDQNIDFEIMNYPGAKHGLTGRKTNIHRYGMMDRFFARNL